MNWISNYVRPRINSLFSRRETPDNLWTKCNECGTMLFHRELKDAMNVCTNCGQCLKNIKSDSIVLSLKDSQSAALIKPVDDEGAELGVLCLLMPLRLAGD